MVSRHHILLRFINDAIMRFHKCKILNQIAHTKSSQVWICHYTLHRLSVKTVFDFLNLTNSVLLHTNSIPGNSLCTTLSWTQEQCHKWHNLSASWIDFKLLVYARSNTGPRIDPCGTSLEKAPQKFFHKVLLNTYTYFRIGQWTSSSPIQFLHHLFV